MPTPFPPVAIALVLGAACTHAAWNLVVKQAAEDRELVTWLALGVGGVLLAPALTHAWTAVATAWPFVTASAAAEAAYVVLLTAAYRSADLSVVYPVARGTAPLLLALWTSVFLGQVPRRGGMLGIAMLAAGVIMVASTAVNGRRGPDTADGTTMSGTVSGRRRAWVDIALTLGVALCISTYSAVDGAAMRRVPPAAYEGAVFVLGAVMTTPFVVGRDGGRRVRDVLRRRWRRTLVVGVAMAGAYVAILRAFSLAPIAYVGATREVSIVIAALAGWRALGEPFRINRLIGSAVIVAGIAAILLLG